MAKVSFTPALRAEYKNLFETCFTAADKKGAVEALVDQLAANRARYEKVGDTLGIPWQFIAVIHNMESSQRFDRHLHNGDPLTARTKQVPAGRPKTGTPPFTWEASAADALTMRGIGSGTDWSLEGTLYQIEGYNGWGYRSFHPHVLSPYLWSFSNHYTSGKYVADGTWSDSAKSAQCGAAVLLRRMAERKLYGDGSAAGGPAVVAYSMTKSADPAKQQQALALQAWLNTHPGIFVALDAAPGQRTSDAYKQVTGHYLRGDPRG
jgi:lysozyme family protein